MGLSKFINSAFIMLNVVNPKHQELEGERCFEGYDSLMPV